MKYAAIVLFFLCSALSPAVPENLRSNQLQIELRATDSRIKINEDIQLSVFFRSPHGEVTIWNALGWGAPAGLYLEVLDSSGRQIDNQFSPFFHPMPPAVSGKGALISIGGDSFAGFDSRIEAKVLFPGPGTYKLRCRYAVPLSRNYFKGLTIWGKEDGDVESAPIAIIVDAP